MWLLYIWCSSCCAWLSPTTFSNFDLAQNVGLKFLDRPNSNHILFFKVVQNLFYQTLECAGPKKKFFEDSTLKAQNSIANFDIKANKARHPLASTRFFTEFLEFRDKRERKKTRRDGVVLSKEKGSWVETRVDRPDHELSVFSTTPIASYFWHCHFPVMALPLHGL